MYCMKLASAINAHRQFKGCHVWRQFSAIRFDFDADVVARNDDCKLLVASFASSSATAVLANALSRWPRARATRGVCDSSGPLHWRVPNHRSIDRPHRGSRCADRLRRRRLRLLLRASSAWLTLGEASKLVFFQ
jgi:hypothetical protein